MTIAINEMLKQVEFLSRTEQDALAAKLAEQRRQNVESASSNGSTAHIESPLLRDEETNLEEEEESIIDLDVSSLNHVPPKWTYMAEAQFYYAGRGKPMPYDLSEIFPDEEATGE